jgi:putative ABC transport system substrate-binding protein
MKRRQFITLLSGAAAAWPLAARAQQGARMRRISVLMGWDENDPVVKGHVAAFAEELRGLGWINSQNVQIDVRWAAGNVDRMRAYAKELVELQPDVIVSNTTPVTAALQRETRTIPIVFIVVSDPVSAGFVANLPRPGGNITGFINLEAAMASKWLELLTEIMPGVKHAAILFNPDTAPGGGSYFLPSFEAAAKSFAVDPIIAQVHTDAEIETVIMQLGRAPTGGLVVMTDSFTWVHHKAIVLAAARNNVPAVYPEPEYARAGGLLSYGEDTRDLFRRAAPYVDRILRGAKPAELPVQVPTKFEMVINLKTARALSINVPPELLTRADEVIE